MLSLKGQPTSGNNPQIAELNDKGAAAGPCANPCAQASASIVTGSRFAGANLAARRSFPPRQHSASHLAAKPSGRELCGRHLGGFTAR
jgi:hypothetical protein